MNVVEVMTYERVVAPGWLSHHGGDEEVMDLLSRSVERLASKRMHARVRRLGESAERKHERAMVVMVNAVEKGRMSFVRTALWEMREFESFLERAEKAYARNASKALRKEERAELRERLGELLAERDELVADPLFKVVDGWVKTRLMASYEGIHPSERLLAGLVKAIDFAEARVRAEERRRNGGDHKAPPAEYLAKKARRRERDRAERAARKGNNPRPPNSRGRG